MRSTLGSVLVPSAIETLSPVNGNAILNTDPCIYGPRNSIICLLHSSPVFRYPSFVASLPDHLKPLPVGRHKLPREVMNEHQRSRVLDAAIAIFAEKGYPATTVDDLVAAAQIGVGSFYALFEGKEQCLLAAYERVLEDGRRTVMEAVGQASTWADRICLGLQALLSALAADPARGRIGLVEIQTGGSNALARYEETLLEVAAVLASGREQLASDRQPPESLEQTTVSGIAWLLHRRLVLGEGESIPALFGELGELILEPYLGEDGARSVIAEHALTASR
jgi:AcrR family transcriptional regulator